MLILAAAVFFAQRTLPGIMKNLAVKELDEILNTEAEIDDLKVSLWRGIISFSGVRIKNPPGFNEKYFLTVENGFVDISLFALLSKKVDVEEIVLYRPRLNIEINGISRSNAPLVFKKTPPSVAGTAKKTKMQTHLKKIVIQDG
ncbi:MAG: hypothetical protein NTV07_01530, partial [Candidatus Omnitrophica bacterium]|nr:hypothetical protein [Candidatus Omnitrophota bacterium]